VVPALLGLLHAPFTRFQLFGRASSGSGTDTGVLLCRPWRQSPAVFLDHLNKQLILSVALFRRSQVGVAWRGGRCGRRH
jgi:hypothetical protein